MLREARLLRRDLEHEQSRCRNKQRGFEAQKAGAESKRACISGRQGGAPHLARQCAEADHNARDVRLESLAGATAAVLPDVFFGLAGTVCTCSRQHMAPPVAGAILRSISLPFHKSVQRHQPL